MAGLLKPISGFPITQRFRGNHPAEPPGFVVIDGNRGRRARRRDFPGAIRFGHLHGAIDIGCPVGTTIVAPEAGDIVDRGRYSRTGERFMMLQIKPGTILFFTHLSDFRAEVGQPVVRGQEIALSGDTGETTGPHLHWEVRITTRLDPDFHRSGRWSKWNPRRMRKMGDLAILRAIMPPGRMHDPNEISIEIDHDPLDEIDDPADDAFDTFGDAAILPELGPLVPD